jgi:GMP synthase-like glutamine amidotransferase
MRAHYFQHVPFEGLGSIGPWLESRGASVTGTRVFEKWTWPAVNDVDFLIVMGGPMSVNDESSYPWLKDEKRFIKESITRGKAVLGVCLGAQLITSAMGARVYPNAEKEIGWFPIHSVAAPEAKGAFQFPKEAEVFHWHGETFDLPPRAIRLARSAACENQAFQLGRNVIGLQFHLETTPEGARDLATHCRHELVPAKFVQSEETILSARAERYAAINALMSDVLSFLVRAHG